MEEREEILINHSMENNNEDNGSDISNHTIKILDNFLIINESSTNRNLLEGTGITSICRSIRSSSRPEMRLRYFCT